MNLKGILKNESYRKILKFFHENPASIDTGRGVATWTDQDIKEVREALKRLASIGLLVDHKVSSVIGYGYTRNKKMVAQIARLLGEYE